MYLLWWRQKGYMLRRPFEQQASEAFKLVRLTGSWASRGTKTHCPVKALSLVTGLQDKEHGVMASLHWNLHTIGIRAVQSATYIPWCPFLSLPIQHQRKEGTCPCCKHVLLPSLRDPSVCPLMPPRHARFLHFPTRKTARRTLGPRRLPALRSLRPSQLNII